MKKCCYIEFEVNPTIKYAYLCGSLSPEPDSLVVILVGKEAKKKIVKCVGVGFDDPQATATIFGLVQEQPK